MLVLRPDDPLIQSLFTPQELRGVRKLQRRKRGKRAGELTTEQEIELQFEQRGLTGAGYSREYKFATHMLGPNGRPRQWRFDFAWPGVMLAAEFEGLVMRKVGGQWQMGGAHGSIVGFREDCEKYNAAALLGWTVLRYEKVMVYRGQLYADVEVFLREHGVAICPTDQPLSIPARRPASTVSNKSPPDL